ncbi:MAG: preprotein translocase subunit SecY, partial [archaeon]
MWDSIKPILNILPEVETPQAKPKLKERLIWTFVCLLIFGFLGIIVPIGIGQTSQSEYLLNLQLVLGSKIGTLASLGIGPIVLASIFLQL